mgnify:CR=1 FL=1
MLFLEQAVTFLKGGCVTRDFFGGGSLQFG